MTTHACKAAFSTSKNDAEQLKFLIKRSVPVQMEELGSKRETFPCEACNDQMQAGEDQKLERVVQRAGAGAWHAVAVAHSRASPAWAAAMASVWHFGCSCG